MAPTHVLWPTKGDTGDARDLLEAKGEQSLPRLALRAGLDLVERRLGSRVLLMAVVMTLVVVVVVVTLMVRVVGVDFLNGGRHLRRRAMKLALSAHSSRKTKGNPSTSTPLQTFATFKAIWDVFAV